MKATYAYADLSKARKHKVGTVIVRGGRIVSVGYNGTVAGGDNQCEDLINGALVTRPEVIHAEVNAIAFAARVGVATEGCMLVTTTSPCLGCAKVIAQAGITGVVYDEAYTDITGVRYLETNNIPTWRLA